MIGIVAIPTLVMRRPRLFFQVDYLAVLAKGMGNKGEMEDKLRLPGQEKRKKGEAERSDFLFRKHTQSKNKDCLEFSTIQNLFANDITLELKNS